MTEFKPSKKTAQDFNNGQKYINGDGTETGDVINADMPNNVIEGFLYTQGLAVNAPDVSEANQVGVASASIVTATDGTARLKFSNLKGEQGVGISTIVANGVDADGGNIYNITLDDGRAFNFVAPKGTTGNTGNGIASTVISYATSTSGTIIPADSAWQSTIPTVAKGSYLWTRTVITNTDGTSSASYSSAYQGMDGQGAIASVNGETGNVIITPQKIGAVARNTIFHQSELTIDTYTKIFTSGKLSYEWDTISLVLMITDVNTNNDTSDSACYFVNYKGHGTTRPATMEIQRLFGNSKADAELYINFNNAIYQAEQNKFEIYYKVGYETVSKNFQVISYCRRANPNDTLNEYTLYSNGTSIANPTSLGEFAPFLNYVETAFLPSTGGTVKGTIEIQSNTPWFRGFDNSLDISATTGLNNYRGFEILDKNRQWASSFRNYNNSSGTMYTQMASRSKRSGTDIWAGVQVTSGTDGAKRFEPSTNGDINLGTPSNKWKDVYASTFHGSIEPYILASASTSGNVTASNLDKYKNIIAVLIDSGAKKTYTSIIPLEMLETANAYNATFLIGSSTAYVKYVDSTTLYLYPNGEHLLVYGI